MSKTAEEAFDWADKRAEELLPCEGLEPWCVSEDNVPTGEHYQGDTCHARYRKMFAAAMREGVAHGEAREREAVLAIITETRRSRAWSEWNDALDEAEARIRQRGEK